MDAQGSEPEIPLKLTASTPKERIMGVSVKVPPFWRKNVKIWFIQLEAQFNNINITSELTKYNHVLSGIDTDVLDKIGDFVINPPRNDQYSKLKELLIGLYADSKSMQVKKLLTEIELGDKKPSQLLREMRSLADQQIGDDFLRNMFIQRLPSNVRAVLASSDDSLEKLASMADKILEIASPSFVNEVSKPSDNIQSQVNALQKQIQELTTAISNIGKIQYRSRSRNRRMRSKSNSRDNSKFPNCYYHHKFGAQARRCEKPCAFTPENTRANH